MDSQDGQLLGKGSIPPPKADQKFGIIHIPLATVTDGKFHRIYLVYKPTDANVAMQAGVMNVQFNAR